MACRPGLARVFQRLLTPSLFPSYFQRVRRLGGALPLVDPVDMCKLLVNYVSYSSMSRNPFVDHEAYEDDDEEYGFGGEGGGEGDNEEDEDLPSWVDRSGVNWDDEDMIDTSTRLDIEEFADHLAQRYTAPTIGETSRISAHAQEVEPALRKALMTEETTQSFWRVKCKPGTETDLVFDIMQHQIEVSPAIPTLPHSYPSTIPPASEAVQLIQTFAQSATAAVDEISDTVARVLGIKSLPELWRKAIDATILDPDEAQENPLRGLERFNDLVPELLLSCASSGNDGVCHPSGPLTNVTRLPEQNNSDLKQQWRCEDTSQVFSAFSVADNPGSIYLEAFLTRFPQPQSWVRVTKGMYSGDVGLVLRREITTSMRRLVLLLVPRLPAPPSRATPPPRPPHPNHPLSWEADPSFDPLPLSPPQTPSPVALGKRKHTDKKFEQRLFIIGEFPHFTQTGHKRYQHRTVLYEHGLRVCCLGYSSVTQVDVVMDHCTRLLFRASGHPALNHVPLPVCDDWVFFVEEKVEVIHSAPLTIHQVLNPGVPDQTYLKNATVVNVNVDTCTVHLDDYEAFREEDTSFEVKKVNIRKILKTGDSVIVEVGDMKGRYGFVLSSWGDEVEVGETGDRVGQSFFVHPNVCRLSNARDDTVVPWLNRHITIIRGQYRGYTGIVLDTFPPRPLYTMLEVKILNLLLAVRIRHDDVHDTCANRPLQEAFPLRLHQRHFMQATWGLSFAPNVDTSQVDPHTGREIVPQDLLIRQPDQPWLEVPVIVVKGSLKHRGTVKRVERNHRVSSGLKVDVELNYASAEFGVSPRFTFDYSWVRDPTTGLPLHIRYPLHGRQKYWEPLSRVKAVLVPNPKFSTAPARALAPSLPTPTWNGGDFVDPFQTSEATASDASSSSPASPVHWAVDPRLDGKEFFVRWQPDEGLGMAKVAAKPDCTLGRVLLSDGGENWFVPPHEIFDLMLSVKPTTNKAALVVVRGEHIGKSLRQIFCKYVDGVEEPVITAAVYDKWGTSAEKQIEPYVEVRAEDCAFATSEPNKSLFKEEIDKLRKAARKTESGKTKRLYKPKPR
ncbi:hypothetical protein K435DRAFT_803597 [Dendrothele bispora CBS 962.96]|uniref:Chromatin elongation factor spt5 n=1 Tax=Dendrothele bispora (strain CBS 962.96) TaxID=1314807 RepID=A0A4V4HDU8_DENBC|nr:hypothetical protein K435DRAFT_803597 [Dendrothele bispora CBS 962.96]